METAAFERWVEAYRRAWSSNDPIDIGELFTEDAEYSTAPFREPWTGVDTIVREWLARKDEPETWHFAYDVVAVDGELGVVRGETVYPGQDPPKYSNLWLVRLSEDGRCREFVEYWMPHG